MGPRPGLPLISSLGEGKQVLYALLWVGYTITEGDCMKIEIEREEDGRWIAEIPELPGVMVYGDTRNQAISKAEALALRVAKHTSLTPEDLWESPNQ